MVQRSTLMRYFKANTDLGCIFQEYLLVRDNDKSCTVVRFVIDLSCQDIQSVKLCCIFVADSCLRGILVFHHLLGRHRSIGNTDLLPGSVFIQEMGCLHQSLWM